MSKMNENTKLIALAHLKTGKKPTEVSELLDIPYSTALRLNKELKAAEERNTVLELFNVPEATFQAILKAAQDDLAIAGELISKDEITSEFGKLEKASKGLNILEEELQATATELARQIKIQAATASSSDTVVNLAEALAKLQSSFFAKGTNVQVNNFDKQSFEQYLRD